MSWTQDDVDALKAALASGASSVTYSDGSSISYRSIPQMKEALAMMQAEVSPADSPVKAFRGSPRSGY